MSVGVEELLDLFLRLVRVPSPSGRERELADLVIAFAREVGAEVVEDGSAVATGLGCGNLLVRVPGRGAGVPIALCAHLDTVPLKHAPEVLIDNGVVRTDGTTILGADDKVAVTALLAVLRELKAMPPAGDVEFLFTPGEEIGLVGAKAFAAESLCAEAVFVLDSQGAPGTIVTGAPSVSTLDAVFTGVAAHSGMEPEKGRNAVLAAARALLAMRLGRIDDETTANVGVVEGGSASNVVPERCAVYGEARSHDGAKLAAQVESMVEALTIAAGEAGVDVAVDVHPDYAGYAHAAAAPVLRIAEAAVAEAGLTRRAVRGGGGSDANVFNARGLPSVVLGAGYERAHSPQESVAVEALEQVYRLASALVIVAGTPAA